MLLDNSPHISPTANMTPIDICPIKTKKEAKDNIKICEATDKNPTPPIILSSIFLKLLFSLK